MPEKQRFMVVPAALVLLIKDNKVLLLKRANTGFADGQYTLPSGHVENGELPSQAAIREAKEEVGVIISVANIKLVHVHCRTSTAAIKAPYVDFFFAVTKWMGEPTLCEPEKCTDVQWFPLDALPENTIPFIKDALKSYQKQNIYTEETWLLTQ